MRAPCLMTSISSADLIIRWRMAAWATSTRVADGEGGLDLVAVVQRQRVVLDAEPARVDAAGAQDFLDGEDVVVPAPVRVDDVVAVAAAPRHAGVDVGRDGDGVVLGDHHGVGAAEGR